MNSFIEAIEARRSEYALLKEIPISKEALQSLIERSVQAVPTAFNSQSTRVVVLLGENSDNLWEITRETLRKIVPAEKFADTDNRISSFKGGFGTILFFEDQSVIQGLQNSYPLYKDNFPIWSVESSGMLQLVIWTALSEEGIGASIQHYNPLIDNEVKAKWDIPDSWQLVGQMPFGSIASKAAPKDKQPVVNKVKFIG